MDMRRTVLWKTVLFCSLLNVWVIFSDTHVEPLFANFQLQSQHLQQSNIKLIAPVFDGKTLHLMALCEANGNMYGIRINEPTVQVICGIENHKSSTALFLQLIAGIIYKIVYLDKDRGYSNEAYDCMIRCCTVMGNLAQHAESTNMRTLLQGQGGLPALLGALTHKERDSVFRELTKVSTALAEANGHFFCSSSTVTIPELQENIIAAMAHGAGSRCAQSTATLGAGLMLVALCTEFGRSLIGKIFEGGMHFAAWLFGWQADAATCAVVADSMQTVGAWCSDHPVIAATVLTIGGVIAGYNAIKTLYEAGTLAARVLVYNKGFAPIAAPEKTNRTMHRSDNGKVLEGNAYDFLRANTPDDAALRPIQILDGNGFRRLDQLPQPFLNYLPNITSEEIE